MPDTTVGVVLAGGAGRRIGGDKASVALHGRPLVEYPLAALEGVTRRRAVVAKHDTALPALPPEVEVWCDDDERRHPLIGVATALRHARGAVLVVACDLPHVTPGTLTALRDAPAGRVAVARAEGRLQPLLARYPPGVLSAIRAGAGRAATAVVEELDPLVVDVPAADVFNVNAPEDLLRGR